MGEERGVGAVGKMYNYSQGVREGAIGEDSDAVNTEICFKLICGMVHLRFRQCNTEGDAG